jgi:hypothetical protein
LLLGAPIATIGADQSTVNTLSIMRTRSLYFVSLLIVLSLASFGKAHAATKHSAVIAEVIYWPVAMPGGQIRTDVFVDPSAASFTDSCESMDAAPTRVLFDEIAIATINKGLAEGWIHCTTDCTGSNVNVRIWTAACAQRTGTGCSTHFKGCDTTIRSWRDYEVCCYGNQGGPTITLVAFGSQAQQCMDECEPTVPLNPYGGQIVY